MGVRAGVGVGVWGGIRRPSDEKKIQRSPKNATYLLVCTSTPRSKYNSGDNANPISWHIAVTGALTHRTTNNLQQHTHTHTILQRMLYLGLVRDHVPETLVVHQPDEDVGVHHRPRNAAVQRLGPVVGVPAQTRRRPDAEHNDIGMSADNNNNNNKGASGKRIQVVHLPRVFATYYTRGSRSPLDVLTTEPM